jgi:hypothetical protein
LLLYLLAERRGLLPARPRGETCRLPQRRAAPRRARSSSGSTPSMRVRRRRARTIEAAAKMATGARVYWRKGRQMPRSNGVGD